MKLSLKKFNVKILDILFKNFVLSQNGYDRSKLTFKLDKRVGISYSSSSVIFHDQIFRTLENSSTRTWSFIFDRDLLHSKQFTYHFCIFEKIRTCYVVRRSSLNDTGYNLILGSVVVRRRRYSWGCAIRHQPHRESSILYGEKKRKINQ